MSEPERAPRRRDAEATKQAILDAARACFGEASYDQVSLREIAGRAEIDVALIGRYFGSKEELFAAAIMAHPHAPAPLPADRAQFGEWLARLVVSKPPQDPARVLALHHSVGNPRAADIVREALMERFIRPVGAWLGGPDGELRATLVLSHLTGLGIMRHAIKAAPLADADRETLVALLAPVLQSYVGAEPSDPPSGSQ